MLHPPHISRVSCSGLIMTSNPLWIVLKVCNYYWHLHGDHTFCFWILRYYLSSVNLTVIPYKLLKSMPVSTYHAVFTITNTSADWTKEKFWKRQSETQSPGSEGTMANIGTCNTSEDGRNSSDTFAYYTHETLS